MTDTPYTPSLDVVRNLYAVGRDAMSGGDVRPRSAFEEFDRWLAAYTEQVRAEVLAEQDTDTFKRGYQAAIADMLWLARGRGEYSGDEVQFQVRSVQHVARAMSGDEFAYQGWLPSWLWEQWEARQRRSPAPITESEEA